MISLKIRDKPRKKLEKLKSYIKINKKKKEITFRIPFVYRRTRSKDFDNKVAKATKMHPTIQDQQLLQLQTLKFKIFCQRS